MGLALRLFSRSVYWAQAMVVPARHLVEQSGDSLLIGGVLCDPGEADGEFLFADAAYVFRDGGHGLKQSIPASQRWANAQCVPW